MIKPTNTNIKEWLEPFFCNKCGVKMGFYDKDFIDMHSVYYCKKCSLELD